MRRIFAFIVWIFRMYYSGVSNSDFMASLKGVEDSAWNPVSITANSYVLLGSRALRYLTGTYSDANCP